MRIGLGNDLHRLEAGSGLVLGAVSVPCELKAVAHSDGDVLLHALTDALLGALGQGDIGELFPDHDSKNRDRPSSEFVAEAMTRVRAAGYRVGNADCILMLQQPRLSPFKTEIRHSVAELLEVPVDAVNIKAKTGEKVGPVGTSQAIAAEVAVLLMETDS